jgi:hypothetical protein
LERRSAARASLQGWAGIRLVRRKPQLAAAHEHALPVYGARLKRAERRGGGGVAEIGGRSVVRNLSKLVSRMVLAIRRPLSSTNALLLLVIFLVVFPNFCFWPVGIG